MFGHVTPAPPDAIFGLNDAFAKDPRPDKINLGAGVYRDEDGRTPILRVVKEAEGRILANEASKSYLPIEGHPDYGRLVRELLFGTDHEVLREGRAATVHTPGGTGALRVAADLLEGIQPGARVWLSRPTWPNHPAVFGGGTLQIAEYPYFDPETNGLDLEAMLEALGGADPGDVVILHGCCHNPTGVDPTAEQWRRVARTLAAGRLVPLVDFAYQGFADDVRRDAAWLPILCGELPEVMVASSFSKNFGLYNERVGALTLVTDSAPRAAAVLSRVRQVVRRNYSNPPGHGAAIVREILGDPQLRRLWLEELAAMGGRIRGIRRQFAEGLDARGVSLHASGNGFIDRQNGMFSYSRLGPQQVERLRIDHGIYMVGSGRINVAGITQSNVDRLCDAIAAVGPGTP